MLSLIFSRSSSLSLFYINFLYMYNTNIMLIYIFVCRTDNKTRGVFFYPQKGQILSLLMHLKNIAYIYIRLMPLVKQTLVGCGVYVTTYIRIQADTQQTHSHTHTRHSNGEFIFRVIFENFFVSHTAFLYVKCIMALCNLLWLIITHARFYCTLSPWTLLTIVGKARTYFFFCSISRSSDLIGESFCDKKICIFCVHN